MDLAVDDAGRAVALKHIGLYGSAIEMEHARRRIRREAEVLQRLRHPRIVPLLDVLDDGCDVVLVMTYLAGGTLADRVRDHGLCPAHETAAIADELFDALRCAHHHGVVHRDIKPSNVLFDSDGRAYLADFGIASWPEATAGLTAAGTILGTAAFTAPEQARGEPAGPATDVFGLGATLLWAASGAGPWPAGRPALAAHAAAAGHLRPWTSGLDREVVNRLEPFLRTRPEDRPPTDAPPRSSSPTTPTDTSDLNPRPSRSRLGLSAGVVAAALAIAVVITRGSPLLDAGAPSPAPTPAPATTPTTAVPPTPTSTTTRPHPTTTRPVATPTSPSSAPPMSLAPPTSAVPPRPHPTSPTRPLCSFPVLDQLCHLLGRH